MRNSNAHVDGPFQFTPAADSVFKNALLSTLRKPLTKMLRLDTLNTMYARAQISVPNSLGDLAFAQTDGTAPLALSLTEDFLVRALEELGVSPDVSDVDRANVPKSGPLMVVSNHPFGVVEGLVLARVLTRIRPDVKILANHMLAAIPEMRPMLIELDPFGGNGAKVRNMTGLRAALSWLKQGGTLVAFPSGEVSSLAVSRRMVADPPWRHGVAALVRKAGVPVLPVFVNGRNSNWFQAAGLVHPRLRTLLIPHENLKRCGQQLQLSIGSVIPAEKFTGSSVEEASAYMRFRCHLLRSRGEQLKPFDVAAPLKPKRQEMALAATRPRQWRLDEVAALRPEQILVKSSPFMVFEAQADEIPAIMHEVARLRESTFRYVGEGTGQPLDTDAFDARYRHLILWNVEDQELAGAYRFAGTDEILPKHGPEGLYTSSQFRIKPAFWKRLDPALELGRSFVSPRYQKSYQPLLLLWKGLAEYVTRNPRYRTLFGCVSISGEYSQLARELMVQFLRRHSFDPGLARLVKPTRPHRERQLSRLDRSVPDSVFRDPSDLNELVAEVEKGRGVPVLLRQYLKLGGRIAAFNLDPDFGGCLDGLICVDLALTDERTLARFMGSENARQFLLRHTAARLCSPRAA